MEKPSFHISKEMITFNITQLIKSHLKKINFGNNWEDVCNMYEVQVVMNCFIMVKWLKPPPVFMKLNSDGSCLDGNCGGGGIVRGSDGCLIMAYSLPLGQGTSNTAEASALLYGLKWCINNGFNSIIGETDSLILQNSVIGE
ncbi:uncharacterized protein LOC142175727 [Nicotiana tabacum]|uniref:Uncharacterized protein LOC142175727 n=1 Tax=Nicotiana tabacum TaxID=4097 RepID=A0AC58TNJ6_TOBAC